MNHVVISLVLITLKIFSEMIRVKDRGYFIVREILDKQETDTAVKDWEMKNYKKIKEFFMNNQSIKNIIKEKLNDEYVLINYSYFIENSAIHTYHRDYTSCKNYNNLKFPSYTMILYLDDSDTGLNLIPGSHRDFFSFYIMDKSHQLHFKKGSAVIFDADILHAGTSQMSGKIDRKCIQFKIIHKEDISKLPWLQNFHMLIDSPNDKNYYIKVLEAGLTKHFPFFMDSTQTIIKTSFNEEKTFIQKLISMVVFSNTDFYKPKKIT